MKLKSVSEAINEVTRDKVANKSKVNVDDKSVSLQQKTIDLLAFLYVNKNKAHTRDDIMRSLWGKEAVGTRVIDIYIMDIRKKLGKDIILSVPGIGYKFNSKYDVELSSSYPKESKVTNEGKVITFVVEAMDPNYKKWRKANVTYRGTREDNPWPLDGIDEYEGKFGKGLYTTPLSNKAMTKDYGKTWLIVGGIPKNPIKFRSINDAEIWFQQYAVKNGKGADDIDKIRNFWSGKSGRTIDSEMTKQGYDGVLISGREMVLFNPDKEKLRAFETERQLEKWYDDFFSPSTDPVEFDGKGGFVDPTKKKEAVAEATKPNPLLKKFEDWLKKEWLAMEKMKGKAKEEKQSELEEIMLELVADKQSDYVDSVLNDGGEMNPKLFWDVCDEKRVKEYAKSINESNIVKTKGGKEVDLDEYEAKQTILGTIYIHKDRLKPAVFGDLE